MIRCFLKFGQKEHLNALASGKIYCSNAQTFWGIEDKLKIKGQGDRLEASSRFFSDRMTVFNYDDLCHVATIPNCNGLVRYEPAELMPVFCLFTVYDEDCEKSVNGPERIVISDAIKETIKKHFPKADAVAIISQPKQFILDIEQTIGCEVKHGEVQYFNIDKGLQTNDGRTAIDMEYMKYLMQDTPPIVENGKRTFRFLADYAYRALLCKDIFFSDEHEYRFILPKEKISKGTVYQVELTTPVTVMDLDRFFNSAKA